MSVLNSSESERQAVAAHGLTGFITRKMFIME